MLLASAFASFRIAPSSRLGVTGLASPITAGKRATARPAASSPSHAAGVENQASQKERQAQKVK